RCSKRHLEMLLSGQRGASRELLEELARELGVNWEQLRLNPEDGTDYNPVIDHFYEEMSHGRYPEALGQFADGAVFHLRAERPLLPVSGSDAAAPNRFTGAAEIGSALRAICELWEVATAAETLRTPIGNGRVRSEGRVKQVRRSAPGVTAEYDFGLTFTIRAGRIEMLDLWFDSDTIARALA